MSKRLIYEEDAIEAVHNLYAIFGSEGEWVDRKDVFEAINSLPSAQPEIIRCKDCKHYHYANRVPQEQMCTCEIDGNIWSPDSYCSFAERKEDE